MVLANHLVLDVRLPIRLPLRQVQRPRTAIHVRIHFDHLPDVSLESIPRVPIKSLTHLRCHVAQVERLLAVLLVNFVVARRRHVTSIEAAALVVRVLGAEKGMDTGVRLEVALGSINGVIVLHRVLGEVFEDPMSDSCALVVGEDEVVKGSDVG